MKVYAFAVPGTPIPWKRARRRGAVTFTDPKDALHREKIRAFARNAGLRKPLTGPVYLCATFFLPGDPIAPGAPDRDNLLKSVQDSLEGIAVTNDRQFCAGPVTKVQDAANPRTEIAVWEMP
jgi:Holliday junction resolvase RusA-like endonuclease